MAIIGSAGNDLLRGTAGDDEVFGGDGNDIVYGYDGDDTLNGEGGNDYLTGGNGSDLLSGGTGADQLEGDAGDDTLQGDAGDDVLNGGEGSDTLAGGADNDTLDGGAGDDALDGGDGQDVLTSLEGSDTLTGGNGDDTIRIGQLEDDYWDEDDDPTGVVTVFGGAGNDRIEFGLRDAEGRSAVVTGGSGTDTYGWMSPWAGSNGNVTILDFVAGAGGDRFDLTELLESSSEFLYEGGNPFAAGFLELEQHGTDAWLVWRPEGDEWYDEFTVAMLQNVDVDDFTADNFSGGISPDGSDVVGLTKTGTDKEDKVDGSFFNDTLDGGGNEDEVNGYGGDDVLAGGAGDDIVQGGNGDDELSGGDGDDDLHGGSGDDGLSGGNGVDTLDGGDGFDTLDGGDGNDKLYAGYGSKVLNGGDGDDEIEVFGTGGSGDNDVEIHGGAGNDRIVLDNADRAVSAEGGAGIDVYTWVTADGDLSVTDFQTGPGGDRLGVMSLVAGNSYYDGLGLNPFTEGYFQLVQNGFHALLKYDYDGTGGSSSLVTVATLQNVDIDDLTADNFVGGIDPGGAAVPGQTVIGTQARETIIGGEFNDFLLGVGGDDSLRGNGGADFLDGGSGEDDLAGGRGGDELDGGEGGDALYGGDGNDVLLGGNGNDALYGDDGDDAVQGGAGDDNVYDGEYGDDVVSGDAGNDRLYSNQGDDTLNGGDGNDLFSIDDSYYYYDDGDGHATVNGGAGNDSFTVSLGDGVRTATATGGAGVDVYELRGDYSVIDQITITDFATGAGGDQLNLQVLVNRASSYFDDSIENPFAQQVLRYVQSGSDTLLQFDVDGSGSSYAWQTAARLQNVTAAQVVDYNYKSISVALEYYDDWTELRGGLGVDTLTGNDYDNWIDGGLGHDKMTGRDGDDTYIVDNAGDTAIEASGEGTDLVRSSVSWSMNSNVEQLVLTGSSSINGTGNSLANTMAGNGGANVLNGGTGADAMTGGSGNDTFVVDNTGDRTYESSGGGTDLVQSSITWALGSEVEKLTLTGSAAINGSGNSLANTITGNGGANVINGGSGADSMSGGSGNDTYVVDNSGDKVTEAASGGTDLVQSSISWTLGAELEKLTLTGSGATSGYGNSLANTIVGNGADNRLDGNGGKDTLTGGAGKDKFIFNDTLGSSNVDGITDFSLSSDRIVVDNDVFKGIAQTDATLSSAAFRAGAGVKTAGDSSDRIIYNTTTGELYYDSDGTGSAAAVVFAKLATPVALTSASVYVEG